MYAEALRAGLAALSGGDKAVTAFRRARAAFEGVPMPLHVAAADHRIGELTGDTALREKAAALLLSVGVKAPERFIDMLLPAVR